MASRKKPSLDTSTDLSSPSINPHLEEMSRMQRTLDEIREEAKQRESQARVTAERMDKQNADLHKALQRMTDQQDRLNLFRTHGSPCPKTNEMGTGILIRTWKRLNSAEVPEPKKVRKSLQRRQQLVQDVIATLQESGLLQTSRPHPTVTPRGPPPPLPPPPGNISRNSATASDAARIVFRSSFPRSTLTRLENVYFKASVPSGPLWPKRFLIIREALKTLGIGDGIIDMSFVGGSVVHLLVSSDKVDEVEEALRKAGRLLLDFDPLGIPDIPSNQGRSSSELKRSAHDNCVKRLGNLYSRGGQHTKDAVTRDLPPSVVFGPSAPTTKTSEAATMDGRMAAEPKTILKRPASPAQDPRLPLKNRFTALDDDTVMSENAAQAATPIDGLSGKAEAVMATCEEEDLDVMMMVETWMAPTDGIPMGQIIMNGCAPVKPKLARGMGTGRRGERGVLVCSAGEKTVRTEGIEKDDGGRWLAYKVGVLVVVVGYLPPMLMNQAGAHTMMDDFDTFLDSIVDRFAGSPIMVVGDFNARMGARTGDTVIVGNAVRRTWMEAWLDDAEWTRLEPSRGKWTTHSHHNQGRGITDFVFMNTLALLLEPDLVVHEDVTLGSDHSLLTLQLTLPGNIWKLPFSRINIQQLTGEGQQTYRDKLLEGREAVMTRLGLMEVEAAARRVVGTELDWATSR
ncbi:hypothetical protein BC829DRAFT_444628 [Chytridium lagenaria]|nr:hypothetical protein BC829DRAFT_444628 [Chytridium lagenaria]